MTDKKDNINTPAAEQVPQTPHRKPTLAWISLILALAAWCSLMWFNGYVALFVAILAAVAGFAGTAHVSRGIKRLAITAIIAAMVLIVVVASYLVVIKIGMS